MGLINEGGFLTNQQILNMDPIKLVDWLTNNYSYEIPTSLSTVGELEKAGQMLGMLTNKYTYLATTLAYLKITLKSLKRQGKNSEEVEDMMMRRDVFQTLTDVVKQEYQAVSRMITVKQEINAELKMNSI